jgi:hypothetical protein
MVTKKPLVLDGDNRLPDLRCQQAMGLLTMMDAQNGCDTRLGVIDARKRMERDIPGQKQKDRYQEAAEKQ